MPDYLAPEKTDLETRIAWYIKYLEGYEDATQQTREQLLQLFRDYLEAKKAARK